MRLLRAVLGRLDPWAALLLGVLVALAVVILLATPGPWHKVVGQPARVQPAPPPPTDVAVFATNTTGACSAVLWLHIDHAEPALSAIVVAPQTQGFVPGAGFAPLHLIVDEAGPGVAAQALGRDLGVSMDAWVELDGDALRLAVEPMYPALDARASLLQYMESSAAWQGRAGPQHAWVDQFRALQVGLPRVAYDRLNVVTFSNYVLGFGHVRSNLDLEGATGIATALTALEPADVHVRSTGAVIQTCRHGQAWQVNGSVVEQLRQSFTLGSAPAEDEPSVRSEPRPARVLVVLPGAWQTTRVYIAKVRRRLRRSAGAAVAVQALTVSSWSRLVPRVMALAESSRPLAVLVAPPKVAPAAAAPAALALRSLGAALIAAGQPAVMSSRLPQLAASAAETTAVRAAQAQVDAAIAGSGLPISQLFPARATPVAGASASPAAARSAATSGTAGVTVTGAARMRAAARDNVDTLVRACWPGVLAPRLASTRLNFWFPARRRTTVGVVAPSASAGKLVSSRLGVWGYRATMLNPSGWSQPRSTTSVYYRAGLRRAALALAGDLGLRAGAAIADNGAPAALTLSLRQP